MTGDGGPKNVWGEPNDRPIKVEGPCLTRTFNAIMVGGAAGTFYGAATVAWYPDPITNPGKVVKFDTTKSDLGAIGRAIARPAVWFSAAAAAFAATECLAESARGKSDSVNAMLGGMAAGAVIGATTRRFDLMTSAAVGMGLFMFALDFTGPDTVYDSEALREKMHGVLPSTHVESEALSKLKEKYPQHKDL